MNSDYNTTATGQAFAPLAMLDAAIGVSDQTITYYNLVTNSSEDVQVGMSALIDDEIIGIEVITDSTFTVKRGCFDTLSAQHPEDALIWIIDGHIGADLVPYMGSEQIGVKLLPKTSTKGLDIAYSPPLGLTMNMRMIRPYNVGQFKVNGSIWTTIPHLTALAPDGILTWVERNRVIQADQLVGQLDAGVAAEAGTTYHFHVYKADGTFMAAHDSIASGYNYNRALAVEDFNLIAITDTGDYPMYGIFYTIRDGYTSWQAYRVDFLVDTTGLAIGLATEDGNQIITEDGLELVVENFQ